MGFIPKDPIAVEVNGKTVHVGQIKIKHLVSLEEDLGLIGRIAKDAMSKKFDVEQIVVSGFKSAVKIIKVMTSTDDEFVGDLTTDQAVHIFSKIIEANEDSFLSKYLKENNPMADKKNKDPSQTESVLQSNS